MNSTVIRCKSRMPGDATILEIEHEIPYEGAKFSSRYEIHKCTSKGMAAAAGYRQLTLTSSASTANENTAYVTCTAELEPVQINGYHQCSVVDEVQTQRRSVRVFNEQRYDRINEAATYEMIRTKTITNGENDNHLDPPQMNNISKFYINNELQTQFVTIETCSNVPNEDDSLKSPPPPPPTVLKQIIFDADAQQRDSYQFHANNFCHLHEPPPVAMPRCTSLLNLQIEPPQSPPKPKARPSDVVALTPKNKANIAKTISIMLDKHQRDSIGKHHEVIHTRKSLSKRELDDTLINDNVELIERFTSNTLDRSCRVTGELLKRKIDREYHRNACTLPRVPKSHRSQLQRHFYHPRSGNRILDEELPDPNQVKNTREIFERVLKDGDSVANVPRLATNVKTWTRPISESRQPRPQLRKSIGADTCQSCVRPDIGSVSSGTGSDNSFVTEPMGCDRDDSEGNHCNLREGKIISEEILRDIRAYGSCVTYFGGKVVSSTEAFSCSPMAMTIMNEIKQSSPDYQANRKFLLFNDRQSVRFKAVDNAVATYRRRDDDKRDLNTLYEDCNNNEVKRETNTMIVVDEREKEEEEGKLAIKLENSSVEKEKGEKIVTNSNLSAQKWNYAHISVESKSCCDMEFEEFQVLDDKTS